MDTTFVQMTELETRDAGGGVHELEGICVPYNVETRKAGARPERFVPGAFAGIPSDAKVRLIDENHAGQRRPAGVATHLEERAAGLFGRFRFYNTPTGREAFEEVREGTYGGLSIGFVAHADRVVEGVREVIKAKLHHVSLVDEPAYAQAKVLAVRAAADGEDPYEIFRQAPEIDLSQYDDTPLSVRIRRRARQG